ncbi:MAG: hypothetical protein ACK47M_21915 [Caldilinea sp.]
MACGIRFGLGGWSTACPVASATQAAAPALGGIMASCACYPESAGSLHLSIRKLA